MELELPYPEVTPVVLKEAPRETLLGPGDRRTTDEASTLEGRLSVGGPIPIPIPPDKIDEDTAAFLALESAARHYLLVSIACTFHPLEKEKIQAASLTCRLGRSDGVETDLPTAWSMHHVRHDEIESDRRLTVRFGANLHFVSSSIERESTSPPKRRAVTPYGLHESTPYWVLRPMRSRPLEGSYQFAAVVRAPRGIVATSQLELKASVMRRRWGVLHYTAVLPESFGDSVPLTFGAS